jgi:hypothetical protein
MPNTEMIKYVVYLKNPVHLGRVCLLLSAEQFNNVPETFFWVTGY